MNSITTLDRETRTVLAQGATTTTILAAALAGVEFEKLRKAVIERPQEILGLPLSELSLSLVTLATGFLKAAMFDGRDAVRLRALLDVFLTEFNKLKAEVEKDIAPVLSIAERIKGLPNTDPDDVVINNRHEVDLIVERADAPNRKPVVVIRFKLDETTGKVSIYRQTLEDTRFRDTDHLDEQINNLCPLFRDILAPYQLARLLAQEAGYTVQSTPGGHNICTSDGTLTVVATLKRGDVTAHTDHLKELFRQAGLDV